MTRHTNSSSKATARQSLIVGKDEWPFPIPLVREHARWRFDTKAGADEILNRRIGRNELMVIEVCRAYVAAQREYAAKGWARRLRGICAALHEQDRTARRALLAGQTWRRRKSVGPAHRVRAGGRLRPGTPHVRPRPYYGYYFRILTQQGQNAPGGAMNYIVNGHMTGGFALIAYPATYGDSGIMTFIVNQNGIVYQKNLGPATPRIAAEITQYDPDQRWQVSKP